MNEDIKYSIEVYENHAIIHGWIWGEPVLFVQKDVNVKFGTIGKNVD